MSEHIAITPPRADILTKRLERALHESEERFYELCECAPVGIFYADARGEGRFVNEPLAEILSIPRDELLYARWAERIHEADRERLVTAWAAAIANGTGMSTEYRLSNPSKGTRWVRADVSPVRDPEGAVVGFVGMLEDLTESRRAESLIAAQNELLGLIVSGAARDETLEKLCLLLEPQTEGARASILLRDDVGTTLRYGVAPHIPESFRAATDNLPVGPNLGTCGTAAFYREPILTREIASDPSWTGYAEIALECGLRACWSTPIFSSTGEVLGTFALYYPEPHDPFPYEQMLIDSFVRLASVAIERHKKDRSLRETEEKLLHAQKMEAIGRLAGGIAHDFNNLLTIVTGYVDILLGRLPAGDPMREELSAVKGAGDRAANLTRQLLAFGRKQMLHPKPLDLNDAVTSMERMLRGLIGEDLDLRIELERDIWKVRADPSQIEQVIVNLAVNARDAMEHGGTITIATANVEAGDDELRKLPEARPGPYVMLSVRDDGEGMDAETLERIFEPFFTTKELGKGSGLGLATVHGIVNQSGGHIWASSELGHGTVFEIYLPCIEEPSTAGGPVERPVTAGAAAKRATIMLVEGDELVRKLAQYVLEADGYRVLSAHGGDDALRISKWYDGPIDLLLTDVVPPKMSGRQLADRLAKLRPGLTVLFMSGPVDDATAAETNFIAKPFLPEALLERVRDLIGDRADETE